MTLNPKNLLHGGDYMNLEKYELLTDVGQRIRARRLELHLSQDELAKLAGYKSRSSINKIEQGKTDIPQTKIRDIAAALSTTVAYIIGSEPNVSISSTASASIKKKEIGLRIMSARESANLTKKDLAKKVHVADSTIMRYEKGQINKIKIPIIESISHALEVNPLWLLGRSNVQSIKTISQNNLCLAENEITLIQKYRALNSAGKATVDAVINVQYDIFRKNKKEKNNF